MRIHIVINSYDPGHFFPEHNRTVYNQQGLQRYKPDNALNQVRIQAPSRAHPHATKQGCAKPEWHITVSAVPTQEAIPEKGGQ